MMDEMKCLTADDQLVEDAIQQIATGFMSQQEYTVKVSEGFLVKKPTFADDQAFAAEHPTHPLASALRFARIKGADCLRDIARERPASLSAAALARTYPYLEDCSATVRLSLVTALFYVGSVESAFWIDKVITHEQDASLLDRSPMVLGTARVAWGRCITQGDYSSPSVSQRILVLSRNLELVSALQEAADRYGAHLYQSHCATDMIGVTAQVQIVDRRCDPAGWEEYLDCLATFSGDGVVETTRLLLIDINSTDPTSSCETQLSKPSGSVFYVSEYCVGEIVRLVDDALQNIGNSKSFGAHGTSDLRAGLPQD